MFKCLLILAASATLAVAKLPTPVTFGQTGHLTTSPPKKDGSESITVSFKLPGQTANQSIVGEGSGINGIPRNGNDDPQTTAEEKAAALADALQDAIDAEDQERASQDPPLGPTGLSATANLDSVDVSLPGGQITKVKKTNNTTEPRDTAMVSPGDGQVAMGEATFEGAISGVAHETVGVAQVWIQIGWEELTVPTQQDMTMRELIELVQRTLETEGFSVMTTGESGFAVVLPIDAPIFGIGSDDRTLEIQSFSAAVL